MLKWWHPISVARFNSVRNPFFPRSLQRQIAWPLAWFYTPVVNGLKQLDSFSLVRVHGHLQLFLAFHAKNKKNKANVHFASLQNPFFFFLYGLCKCRGKSSLKGAKKRNWNKYWKKRLPCYLRGIQSHVSTVHLNNWRSLLCGNPNFATVSWKQFHSTVQLLLRYAM